MKKRIIVLGMHRSGTSVVTQIIHDFGVFANAPLVSADRHNPQGHWEYIPLVRFNHRLLANVESSWCVPPSAEGTRLLATMATQPVLRNEALELLAEMDACSEPAWVWKDPRLSILLPFWQPIWGDEVTYVLTLRSPLSVAGSLQRRNGFPISVSVILWQCYMSAILSHLRPGLAHLMIDYDRLIEQPLTQCNRLHVFLASQASLFAAWGKTPAAAALLVSPELRRACLSACELPESQLANKGPQQLYLQLCSATRDQSTLYIDRDLLQVRVEWRPYLQTVDFLRRLLRKLSEDQLRSLRLELPTDYRRLFDLGPLATKSS